MLRKRTWIGIAVVVLLLAAVGLLIWQWRSAPPEAVRLLPESDAYFYINLGRIRLATSLEKTKIERDADYDRFVQETGFQFERDLNEAAFALHRMPSGERRYSEVFIGNYDVGRMRAYLQKLAKQTTRHHDVDVFQIPVEDRTVRVALLGSDIAAISNAPTSLPIEQIIDNYKQGARPGGGAVLRARYRDVPVGSVAWLIARMGSVELGLPGGMSLSLPENGELVASARWTGKIELRGVAFTSTEEQALRITDHLQSFLALFREIERTTQPSGADPDVKAFFESINVHQEGTRAIMTATMSAGFVKKAVAEKQ